MADVEMQSGAAGQQEVSVKVKEPKGKVLWGCMPIKLALECIQNQKVVGYGRDEYIGLRETHQDAFDRVKIFDRGLTSEKCWAFAVVFTPTGWLHCTTTMTNNGWQRLSKKGWRPWADSGIWHYNETLPMQMISEETGKPMVHVVFHPLE